jgi:hypothetical protein
VCGPVGLRAELERSNAWLCYIGFASDLVGFNVGCVLGPNTMGRVVAKLNGTPLLLIPTAQ